jgi:hypothetical protein
MSRTPSDAVHAGGQVLRAQFRSGFARLAGKAPHGVIRGWLFVELAPAEPSWTQTGIDLRPGDWVTTLAVACGLPSRTHEVRLWMRVGCNGTIFRGTRNTHSFLAYESGPLQVARCLPGESADRNPAGGSLAVGVILWNGPTLRGLKQIARLGELDGLIDAEIDRIRNDEPPKGWRYDQLLGPPGI